MIDELRSSLGSRVALLDEHSDPVHNRTVFTLAGDEASLLPALVRLAGPRGRADRHHPPGRRAPANRLDRRLSDRLAPRGAPAASGRPRPRGRRAARRARPAGLPLRRAGEHAGAPRARPLSPWRPRRADPADARGRSHARLRPGGPAPDRRRRPRHGAAAARRLQPRAGAGRDARRRHRDRRRRCASPAAGRLGSGRSRSSSGPAGSRSPRTSTTRSRCRSPRSSP